MKSFMKVKHDHSIFWNIHNCLSQEYHSFFVDLILYQLVRNKNLYLKVPLRLTLICQIYNPVKAGQRNWSHQNQIKFLSLPDQKVSLGFEAKLHVFDVTTETYKICLSINV